MKAVDLNQADYFRRNNDEVAIIFDEQDFGGLAKLQIVKVDPHKSIPKHKHFKRTELLKIESGVGEIIVDGEVVGAKTSDFVLCKPGEIHEVINKGDDTLTVVVIRINEAGDDDVEWISEEEKNG